MKRNLIPIGGAVAALIVLASANAATTAVPGALVGTWGKTMQESTWTRYHIPGEPGGHYAIAIDASGIAKLYHGTDPTRTKRVLFPFTTMSTAAAGGTVKFGPTTDGFCPGGATYTWTVSGGRLALKLVKDDCDARRVLMTAGAFARE